MKTPTTLLVACIVFIFICLLPAGSYAQVTLLSPPDGAVVTSSPYFSWTYDPYDAFVFFTLFYYDVGGFTGYYPVWFWYLDTTIMLPPQWWDKVGMGAPCYWAVFGYDTGTGQGAWSRVFSFTKASPP